MSDTWDEGRHHANSKQTLDGNVNTDAGISTPRAVCARFGRF